MKKYLAEMVGTMVLVLMGCGAAVSLECDPIGNQSAVVGATAKTNGATNKFAGLAIGLSLVLVHLACIRYTGTSVNPARSIGPALFQGGSALANLWIFIVGPLVGSALAALVWKIIEPEKK